MFKIIKKAAALLITAVILVSVFPHSGAAKNMGAFYMLASDNPSLSFDLKSYKDNDAVYYLFLPNDADRENLKIRTAYKVDSISNAVYDEKTGIISCNASDTDRIYVSGQELVIMQSSLPSLSISVNNGYSLDTIHEDKEAKIKATAQINGAENEKHNLPSSPIEIKTRGNTTFWYDKKPYQIKFDSKTDLFGMGKAKKWILLANYIDGTSVRNKAVFDLGDEIGMPYTCKSVFVDLYIDGEYKGVYQLAEKVEAGSSRVDLEDDFGVILEMDANNRSTASGDVTFVTLLTEKLFVYKDYVTDFEDKSTPESINKTFEVCEFVENYIDSLETELYRDEPDWEKISSMIDVDSFIDFYFITEFTMEPDSGYTSTYFYIDGKGDVLHCGPLWDYDRCWGWNDDYEHNPEADYLKNIKDSTDDFRSDWFTQLFRIPEFAERVNEVYDEKIKAAFETSRVQEKVDAYQEKLMPSLMMNHVKWVVFHNRSNTVDEIFKGTTEEYINYTTEAMKKFIADRNRYLEKAYGMYSPIIKYSVQNDEYGDGKSYTGGVMTEEMINNYDIVLPVKSFSISIEPGLVDGGVEYSFLSKGKRSGTYENGDAASFEDGSAIQAISVKLTGNAANYYSVQYRVFANDKWSTWATNGQYAGRSSPSDAYNITRMQIRVLKERDVSLGTVKYIIPGDSSDKTLCAVVGNVFYPEAAKREGYIFEGWYDNPGYTGAPIQSFTVVSGETVLYAKFKILPEIPGDADRDGEITMKDVLVIRKYILGTIDETKINITLSDIDNDGDITMKDAMKIRQMMLGIDLQ